MVYSVGTAVLQVVPSFTGLQARSQAAARDIERQLREAVRRGLTDGLGAGPALGPARRTGAQVGGTLASSIRSQLQAALRVLPKVEVDANTSPAKREIQEIRAEIAALVPRIGVNVDTEEAAARIAALQAQLEAISTASTDIDVRADTASASAALARIAAEVARLNGTSPVVRVDVAANEGRFIARLRAAIEAAQTALPEINVQLNSTPAEVAIASLRSRLLTLQGREIDVDISAADALAELTRIRAELDRLGASEADVRVDVDAAAASAELAAFEALVAAADANDVEVDVDVGRGLDSASGRIVALVAAVSTLLPALAPIGAVAGAALGGIGAAAVASLPAVGTLGLALFGTFEAVRQLSKATKDAAAAEATIASAQAASASAARGVQQAEAALMNTRASSAAAAAASARAIADAQDRVVEAQAAAAEGTEDAAARVAAAQADVERAQRSAAEAAEQAAQRVAAAQDDAAQAAEDSARRVADAQRDAARAAADAAARVETALDRQAAAETDLADAQREAQDAQEAITQARKDADEALQDLTLNVEEGALRQRQAVLDVQEAQQALAETLADPAATAREKAQAQLRVETTTQALKEIQLRNDRLAKEQAAAQAGGITGQDAYTEATARAAEAIARQGDAERAVADARTGVDQARLDAAQAVADAQQAVADAQVAAERSAVDSAARITEAQAAQARQARDGAESVASSQAALVTAQAAGVEAELDGQQRIADARTAVSDAVLAQAEQQRQAAFSLASAEGGVVSARAAAAQAATAESKAIDDAGKDARDALAALTPAGAAFALFLYGLREPLGQLRAVAQETLLPGLTDGLTAGFAQLPIFLRLTETFGVALGDLFRRAGEAFGGDTFQRFFDFLDRQAAPTLDRLGTLFGNVFLGLIDLFIGFEPYLAPFLDGLIRVTGAFADFAAGLASNRAFQDFLAYAVATAPLVSEFFGKFVETIVRLGIALAPIGEVILQAFTGLFDFIDLIGPTGIQAIFAALLGGIGAVVIAVAGGFIAALSEATLIATGISAAIGALTVFVVKLYQENETFKAIVDAVWKGISNVIGFYIDKILIPYFKLIVAYFTDFLGPAYTFLWRNVVEPAFQGIAAVVKFAWENVMRPALQALVTFWRDTLAPGLNRLWLDVFLPAFAGISKIIDVFWIGAQIIFAALVFAFDQKIRPALTFLWKNVFEPAFSGIGAAVKTAWEDVISPALDALRRFFVDTLGPAIQTGVSAFTTAFGEIRAAAAKPINFIINTVYRDGIKKFFDKVAETVGSDKRMPDIAPVSEEFQPLATGGPVRGYSPSRTADNLLIRATAREFMQPVDAVDYYGVDTMEAIRRRQIPRERLQGLAAGGTVEDLLAFGKRIQGLGYLVTENAAFGDPPRAGDHSAGGWHYKFGGRGAIDVNTRPGTSKLEQDELARIIPLAREYGLRSIFMAPGHYNHAHFDVGGSGVLGNVSDAASSALAGVTSVLGQLWAGATDALSPFTDLAKRVSEGVGGSAFGRLAGSVATSGIDLVKDWVRSKVGSAFGGSGETGSTGEVMGPAAAGVERWRSTALQALTLTGSPATWISSLLRRMNQESGGNPRAVNNWDVNAKRGTPSKGLMQTIDPTFRANALPGYDRDVFDPLSNIIASIRYATRRYGSAPTGWDRKGGYSAGGLVVDGIPTPRKPLIFDSGGYLPPGVSTVVNALGRPEPLGNLEGLVTPSIRPAADGPLIGSLYRDVYPVEKVDHDLLFREAGWAMTAAGLGG